MKPDTTWSKYYKATSSKPPHLLLIEAIKYVKNIDTAIDIGGGALNDTKYLLEQGFNVTVIDKSPLIEGLARQIQSVKIKTVITSFEDFDFPHNSYDLASAMFSLPFTNPDDFNSVFQKIINSLKKDGIFCGTFFGDRDGWAKKPNMTFHKKEELNGLLGGLETLSFKETEEDGTIADGTAKHWHFFNVIARKI